MICLSFLRDWLGGVTPLAHSSPGVVEVSARTGPVVWVPRASDSTLGSTITLFSGNGAFETRALCFVVVGATSAHPVTQLKIGRGSGNQTIRFAFLFGFVASLASTARGIVVIAAQADPIALPKSFRGWCGGSLCFGYSASSTGVSRAVVVVATLAHPVAGFECWRGRYTDDILPIMLGNITLFTLHARSVVVISTTAHPISSAKIGCAGSHNSILDAQEISQTLVGEYCIAHRTMQLTPVAPNTVPIVVVAALAHPIPRLEGGRCHDGLTQITQKRTLSTRCTGFVIVIATLAHPIPVSKAFGCRDNGLRLAPAQGTQHGD